MTKEMKQNITILLKEYGFSKKYKGFNYIRDAVYFCLIDTAALYQLSNIVYPLIARKYNTTPNAVENAIRRVINKYWELSDDICLKKTNK